LPRRLRLWLDLIQNLTLALTLLAALGPVRVGRPAYNADDLDLFRSPAEDWSNETMFG
jgi:hypothetical protein